ncbi:MAG: cyclic-di-AMP receptor [Streptococcaceae bacterium]|nr:cyclic-di-AMP receptor [Streptococcaceae bacterium]
MKMILAIVQDKDANRLANRLIDENVRATKLSSTGGFLKAGNATFIIGIDDERVDEVLKIIEETSKARKTYVQSPITLDLSLDGLASYPIEVEVGGATVFVLPIEKFLRF